MNGNLKNDMTNEIIPKTTGNSHKKEKNYNSLTKNTQPQSKKYSGTTKCFGAFSKIRLAFTLTSKHFKGCRISGKENFLNFQFTYCLNTLLGTRLFTVGTITHFLLLLSCF